MSIEKEVSARCVWGHGPRDILLVAETAFVFGPVRNPGHIKEGSGWATVHIDLTKQQAQDLIVQLQGAIDQTNEIEESVIASCQLVDEDDPASRVSL